MYTAEFRKLISGCRCISYVTVVLTVSVERCNVIWRRLYTYV